MAYEKTQPGNPYDLTVRQHIIPAASIGRFCAADGRVEVKRAPTPGILRVKPSNGIFTVNRVWDQRAESGWMKRIEDEFQQLIEQVLCGNVEHIQGPDVETVSRYYSLWYWRSRELPPDDAEIQLRGITGSNLTKAEEERLEKLGYLFVRQEGKAPARQLTGVQLQMKVMRFPERLGIIKWGVIQTKYSAFVMPDTPSHGFIPIAPRVMLAANHDNGTILKRNLIKINLAFLAYTSRFFLAQNIHTAMTGITDRLISETVKARDREIASGQSSEYTSSDIPK